MSRIFLMTTLLLFGGCGIFEQFAAGLAGIIRENEDSPLFAYVIDQEPPLVRIAVLTDDNAGLILRATDSLPE